MPAPAAWSLGLSSTDRVCTSSKLKNLPVSVKWGSWSKSSLPWKCLASRTQQVEQCKKTYLTKHGAHLLAFLPKGKVLGKRKLVPNTEGCMQVQHAPGSRIQGPREGQIRVLGAAGSGSRSVSLLLTGWGNQLMRHICFLWTWPLGIEGIPQTLGKACHRHSTDTQQKHRQAPCLSYQSVKNPVFILTRC